MPPEFATFLGWAFPDIPAHAELIHVRGAVKVPPLATLLDLDGVAPFGGTGFLFNPAAINTTRRLRARLIGAGVGVSQVQRTLHASGALGALAASATLDGLLSVSEGVLPAAPLEAAHAGAVLSANADMRLDRAGVVVGFFGPTNGQLALPPGVIDDQYSITEVGGVGGTWSLYATDASPSNADELVVDVVRSQLVSGVLSGGRVIPAGRCVPVQPEALAPGVSSPRLLPVAPGVGLAALAQAGEGFGVRVTQAAAGAVSEGGDVVATLAIAVWEVE